MMMFGCSRVGKASGSRSHNRGFTLVELLVVIAIIGILIALLLPAIQAARESARRMDCSNHLKQIGLATQSYYDTQKALPSGGYGYTWAPHPDRGLGINQTGSWLFSILPFMEYKSLTQYGKGVGMNNMTAPALLEGNKMLMQTPLAVFNCSTRRAPLAYAVSAAIPFVKTPTLCASLDVSARCDYAANGGEIAIGFLPGPTTLPYPSTYLFPDPKMSSGVIFVHNRFKFNDIVDGTSKTILAAEKYTNPDHYKTGIDPGDDQGPYISDDRDSCRFAAASANPPDTYIPKRDRPGLEYSWAFGSAHPQVFNAVMCDGSVQSISFEISQKNHRRLCNRADKQPFESPNPF